MAERDQDAGVAADQPASSAPGFEAEGLLEGLEGEARDGRLRLLTYLFENGIGLEDLRRAVAEDRLVILPAEHALGSDPSLSAREICERSGLPLEYFLALRGAQGLAAGDPDERAFGDEDLEAARLTASFYELGLDRDSMLEVARVVGRGMTQTADAIGELFRETFIRGGVSEEELGLRNAEAAREWIPRFTPLLEYLLKQHVRERLRHQAVSQAMLEAGELPGAEEIAVAFADMVAFTSMGERLGPEEVGSIAGRLEKLASECAKHPVRLVKMIGDAAMLASREAEALLAATLLLLQRAEETEGFPQLRAGIAYGPALNRSGDWYGHAVNLASRITAEAEPGRVAATKELCDAAGEVCTWASVGARNLKGIRGEVELFQAENWGRG
jgi:adenylate cyclase